MVWYYSGEGHCLGNHIEVTAKTSCSSKLLPKVLNAKGDRVKKTTISLNGKRYIHIKRERERERERERLRCGTKYYVFVAQILF